MTEQQLIGYDLEQHREISELVLAARTSRLPQAGVQASRSRAVRPPVRVIAMTDRTYDSKKSAALPYFRYDRARTVFTAEQVGSALAGYLALTINGTRFILECRRTHLDDVKATGLVRATVFPGLWEFDFGNLDPSRITITVANITAAENTTLCALFTNTTSVIFTGATIVRQEYWVSVPEEGRSPAVVHQPITDCIPYQTSNVPKGAIGVAMWSWDAGYLAMAWQCRTFSHATGYVQATDPVSITGGAAAPPGGGGPAPVPDPAPP